ncbi:hypothetical protein AArcSl_2653 [Halalkaliarchaeum desulfuricum]|uniref:Uncharacterized protein n=1 Tax=Halalkaliarchaeum desulfuricum TaxID=2055893 RepID=A0A343TMF0_9EURY|nr:hypothetical protein [Halalkaliarchaeum desulfuricum]AUX10272.1 hypothetical protein AArcSl_2653 [Halalkaliarchaeum desulfuricum]
MKPQQILTIGIALSVLLGGAMVLGVVAGAATGDQPTSASDVETDEETPDEPPANETDDTADNESDAYVGDVPDNSTQMDPEDADASDDVVDRPGADDRPDAADEHAGNADENASNADGVGPADGLPEQAADHVSEIHETIDSFPENDFDFLGDALSDLLSNGDAADDGTVDDAAADS